MSYPLRKMSIRAFLVGVPETTADNDHTIINPHATLDALADKIAAADAEILRAQSDLAEAQLAKTEALEQADGAIAEALEATRRASDSLSRLHAAFLKRCSEKFNVDPLPIGELTLGGSDVA